MPSERVALYLQDAHSLQDGIKYAQYAESKGFEAVWQAESRLVRDAIVPMAAFAATTERIKIGAGVIQPRRYQVIQASCQLIYRFQVDHYVYSLMAISVY